MARTDRTPGTRRWVIDWSAAIWAGVIAGAVFMILEMLMVPMFMGGSPWGPPRMIAAMVMGEGVLPMPEGPPLTFDMTVMMVAMVVHFLLSVLFTIVLAFVISGMTTGAALAVGSGYGLVLYLVNFYVMTAVFPWFGMARNWVSIFAHIMFGLIAAAAYKGLQKPEVKAAPPAGERPVTG